MLEIFMVSPKFLFQEQCKFAGMDILTPLPNLLKIIPIEVYQVKYDGLLWPVKNQCSSYLVKWKGKHEMYFVYVMEIQCLQKTRITCRNKLPLILLSFANKHDHFNNTYEYPPICWLWMHLLFPHKIVK